jgi:hypothetical protein
MNTDQKRMTILAVGALILLSVGGRAVAASLEALTLCGGAL